MKKIFRSIILWFLLWTAKVSKLEYYYVCMDITPDWNTGQGEMESIVVKAPNQQKAEHAAIRAMADKWGVCEDQIYVVESYPTKSPTDILDE